ncbi:MAG: hypothetical protein M1816_002222 [Peltula sp. TS41687]|nr:MAG: hypothetical protein M1816_002222 [Peltula sp. TS41687]
MEDEKMRRRSRGAHPSATSDASLLGHGRGQPHNTGRSKRKMRRVTDSSWNTRIVNRDQNGEIIYELGRGDPESDAGSDEEAEEPLQCGTPELESARGRSKSRISNRWILLMVFFVILLTFVVLLFGTYQATLHSRSSVNVLSNGTSNFLPTTVLVSLDGFRADFLNRGLTPTLNSFIKGGVSPAYMLPSFPSVTFPNHFTLVTGLYPESHGVVGNTFWDPALQEEFYYTNQSSSMQAKWWAAEPLWVTAETQGLKSAIHMWPGSEAHIAGLEPTYLDRYNGTEVLSRKVDRILEFLDLPGHDEPEAFSRGQRPQLIAAYVPVVDSDGHKYGPNSTEIRNTIARVDDMLHGLFAGLEERNLTKIVNIVVVSDHGMATTSADRLIQYDDLIDPSLIEHTDGWPLYGLRPKKIEDLQSLYETLSSQAAKSPNYDVYLKDKDMPERYHFSKNDRIAPLWIVPRAGWAIVTRAEFDIKTAQGRGDVYHPRGLHGYDHEDPLMRAIFVARGPAFPHKPNSKLEVFQNTEVYNIICDSLHLNPKPNNGTLRLPLKPVGLHSDNNTGAPETPYDPAASNSPEPSSIPSLGKNPIGVDQPDAEPLRPVIEEAKTQGGVRGKIEEIWNSILSKIDDFRDWIHKDKNDKVSS